MGTITELIREESEAIVTTRYELVAYCPKCDRPYYRGGISPTRTFTTEQDLAAFKKHREECPARSRNLEGIPA